MAKKTETSRQDGPGFEQLLSETEALAERMEDGGLSLDESIAAYEKGVANLRRCAELLHTAEQKVKILIEKNGEFMFDELDPAAATELNGDSDDGDAEE
ncbi:MAG: exodeoxyribonuclease VII small subunit, partial [Planctomycetes bacterium]|nr:exodeoxyribonuclease VII small subunit [Planctomycetota bacterium]